MNNKVNPKMFILARESRGYNQSQLAEELGVSQGTVSKIENSSQGAQPFIDKISEILHYPQDFFFENNELYPPGINFYRKYETLQKKELDQIAAQVDIQRIHIQKLLHSTEICSDFILNNLEHDTPEDAAGYMREYWRISNGPIDNLTSLLEGTGILVVARDFNTNKFSAVTKYTEESQYIIVINDNMPFDRYRFTLAHELGHIILHRISKPEAEDEANAFASELLMPENDIKQYLFNLNLKKLATLKLHWKVSMGSLIERAYTLKTITQRQRRYLWTQMATHGYKRREPPELDVPKERPNIINELIELHTNDLGYSQNELCKLLNLYMDEFLELYNTHSTSNADHRKPNLRIV